MEAASMAHVVVAKRPFSPTVHLGQRELGDSCAGHHHHQPQASTSQDDKKKERIEAERSFEAPGHEIKAFKHAYIKVPATLKDKLPLDYQFRFKPQRQVVSLQKKKKKSKPKPKGESSSHPANRHPVQISHTTDKTQQRRALLSQDGEKARRQSQKKAKAVVSLTEHAVQTDSSALAQKREALKTTTPKPAEAKEGSQPPVQVPSPFQKQVQKKKEKNTSSSFLSKGGITVYKPRSHRPQPFFKKALKASSKAANDDRNNNATKESSSRGGGATSVLKSPLAPRRFPIAPKLALQEIAKEKELEAKRASDEQKRKTAVAGLLQRAKENIQKEYTKRSQDLESKMQESSQKFTHVSALLQKSQQRPKSSSSADDKNKSNKAATSTSGSGSKARVPLTPANLNKPAKSAAAAKLVGNKASRKERDENQVKHDLEKLLDDGPNSQKAKGERAYPKLWQTNMKKPAPRTADPLVQQQEVSTSSHTTTATASANPTKKNDSDASGKSAALGDLYKILDEEPSSAEKEDEKREEILRFMEKKRKEMNKALKDMKDKELEKRYKLRNVHHEYGESSKLKAKDMALYHKDAIAKAEKRMKARPAWIVEFAVETTEEEEEMNGESNNSGPEAEDSKDEATQRAEVPKKRAMKLVKIPKRAAGQKQPKATSSSDKLKIKSTVKALSTPPKSAKKTAAAAEPEQKPVQATKKSSSGGDASDAVESIAKKKKTATKKKAATKKTGKGKGKKLSKMQKDIDELKEASSVNALSESNLLSQLNNVAQRLHHKLLALEQGGPLSEENQMLCEGLEDLELATNFDAEEAMRATEALHEQLFVQQEYDGSGSDTVQTPIHSPSRSPIIRGGGTGSGDHTPTSNSAAVEAMRATEALHQQLQMQEHVSDSDGDRGDDDAVAEEARKATEALHEQLLAQQHFGDDGDDSISTTFSEIHECVSPVRSIVGSLIEEGSIMSDYTLSPKEKVEADLVTNLVSLIVPSSPEVEHTTSRSPMPAAIGGKSPQSARKIRFVEDRGEFDLSASSKVVVDDGNQDVLPTLGDKYSIVDIYAKKNSPKQQDVEIESNKSPSPKTPVVAAAATSPPPAASPTTPRSLSESQTQTDLPAAEKTPPKTPPPLSSAEKKKTKKKTKKVKKSPSPVKKKKKVAEVQEEIEEEQQIEKEEEEEDRNKTEEEASPAKVGGSSKAATINIPTIPTSATALAGQLQAELARFTTLSDMSDHLSKLEQKIEVVQMINESEKAEAAKSRQESIAAEGGSVDYTEQIKELMNNIYEQQKDLTGEMKEAIMNQSSVFVEKLRDTAAVQSNFYQETLKHTAKEMAQIMSNESTKSLESICASFEDRLKDYTHLQQQMKDSLDSAAKSVEVISRQQSPVQVQHHYHQNQNQNQASPLPSPVNRAVSPRVLEADPSSVIETEYTQDFDSDFDPAGKNGGNDKPADSEAAASEVEEMIKVGSESMLVGSESEIAEDIQLSGSESVATMMMTMSPKNNSSSIVAQDVETDIEVEISEAVMEVTEEEIVEEEEEEVAQEEKEEEKEEEQEPVRSFQSSSGMVLSLEMPEVADADADAEEVAEEIEEEEIIPEEIIPDGDQDEEEIQGFVFHEEEQVVEQKQASAFRELPPLVVQPAAAADEDADEDADPMAYDKEEEDEDEIEDQEMEAQHFVNINDIGYSMRYVDMVVDRVSGGEILKSLEEESDPIHTDHFFKIEEASASSDPEYIYHKLLFDTINEVLLNKINHPDFQKQKMMMMNKVNQDDDTATAGLGLDMGEMMREVKAKVEGMVKFGLVNLDANKELVSIHNLETEEETKVFSDLEGFFKDTREELVDGVFSYIIEDTVKTLNELSSSS